MSSLDIKTRKKKKERPFISTEIIREDLMANRTLQSVSGFVRFSQSVSD